MNYNILSYFMYLTVTVFITAYVGWVLYKNGWLHLKSIFGKEEELALKVNQLLLTGYYLLNFGYAVFSVSIWPKIDNLTQACTTVGQRSGSIILLLGFMHYFNLWITSKYGKKLLTNN
ncbi:MAG: hypothetical protein ACJA0Q_000032 [Saprospiraceae bacterium]|jgi:hypothetical protein